MEILGPPTALCMTSQIARGEKPGKFSYTPCRLSWTRSVSVCMCGCAGEASITEIGVGITLFGGGWRRRWWRRLKCVGGCSTRVPAHVSARCARPESGPGNKRPIAHTHNAHSILLRARLLHSTLHSTWLWQLAPAPQFQFRIIELLNFRLRAV